MNSAATRARPRRSAIDWARGLAVLIMIEAHTLDAWTRASARHGTVFNQLSMLGGFAAPLFLWLAGISIALSAERALSQSGNRRLAMEGVVRRGAEIFILAFLFRLQAFIVSPGSWPVTIFRVDILNIMGIAIALAALAWGLAGSAKRAAWLCAVIALLLAMLTPIVREAGWVDLLPMWVQWHLRPFGDHTTFTLFPWAGFVFAGVPIGLLIVNAGTWIRERSLFLAMGAVGVVLIWLGFYTATLPSIYRASAFWTSSPTFFAIRVGVLMLTLALFFAASAVGRWRLPGLNLIEAFGKNSLFIYWIHVELVYGYATWPLNHRLPLWGTALAYAAFVMLMYRAIALRDWVVEQWRSRAARDSTAGAVPA